MISSVGLDTAVREIFRVVGSHIKMAAPLGLGKPNVLLNAIYERVKSDPQLKLDLFTALSLEIPESGPDLQKRFVGPFKKRFLGENYPDLLYVKDLKQGTVPSNIHISEFYFQAGQFLGKPGPQQSYVSVNYTHVPQVVLRNGINLIVQLLASDGRGRYSLGCNPDLTKQIIAGARSNGGKLFAVGVVHPDMPFFEGDALVENGEFDLIVDDPSCHHPLFALPRAPVEDADFLIGLHASRWVADGGTLQIGIGSLSEALSYATILRHRQNGEYLQMLKPWTDEKPAAFSSGVYGLSELVTDGFRHLHDNEILKRRIREEGGTEAVLHGAFFIGSRPFLEWMRDLPEETRKYFRMTSVVNVNDLYDPDENSLRRQRVKARFFNSALQATLLGETLSDTLDNGGVVSGVGGQYNFVAMAFELEAARSILMLRSARTHKKGRDSNIQWAAGRCTIPRHLRDIFVTEYGCADTRGQSDGETVRRLIEIADCEFQGDLITTAQKNGKLSKHYKLPESAKKNTPEQVRLFVQQWREKKFFPVYPFGTDFTPVEEKIVATLSWLKNQSPMQLSGLFAGGLLKQSSPHKQELEYLNLFEGGGFSAWVTRQILKSALAQK